MKKLSVVCIAVISFIEISAQNVGIGIVTPTQKLDVVGNIKLSGALMPGGTAGATGQVLVSNGAGLSPTWENTAYSGAGRFWITVANNSRSTSSFTGRGGWIIDGATNPASQDDSLDYLSSNETGTDFTISNPGLVNNFITVNRTGLYHFEGTIRYFATSTLSVIMLPRATLSFVANQPTSPDLNFLLLEDPLDKTGGSETSSAGNTYNLTGKFQLNIHLQAGTTCTFITGFNLLRFPSGTDLIALGISQNTLISGHFIAE